MRNYGAKLQNDQMQVPAQAGRNGN